VLHQVGVSFDLYYDARKHKIKKNNNRSLYLINMPQACTGSSEKNIMSRAQNKNTKKNKKKKEWKK